METCNVCRKKIQSFCYHIACNNCKMTYHVKCANLSRDDIPDVFCWYCTKCTQSIFVYNHFDDDVDFQSAVAEGMLDCSFRLHEINNKLFVPFEMNEYTETPLTEIDPDIQFYLNSQQTYDAKCDYLFEESFKEYLSKNNIDKNRNVPLSLFHMNIRSMPKYFTEFELYLDNLNFEFPFIGVTETWLK